MGRLEGVIDCWEDEVRLNSKASFGRRERRSGYVEATQLAL